MKFHLSADIADAVSLLFIHGENIFPTLDSYHRLIRYKIVFTTGPSGLQIANCVFHFILLKSWNIIPGIQTIDSQVLGTTVFTTRTSALEVLDIVFYFT